MSSKLNVLFLGCAFLAVTACGPGAKITAGKEGAAQALYAASGAASKGQDPYGQPIDFSTNVTYRCREGGEAKLSGFQAVYDFAGSNLSVGQKFSIEYLNCGASKTRAGVAILNGTWDVTQAVATTSGSVDVQQQFKGKIRFEGAMNDYLDADISQTVAVNAADATGGSVAMVLRGSLVDSSGSYTFDESVSVTAGDIDVTVASSSTPNP
jgi:hypothetical protein